MFVLIWFGSSAFTTQNSCSLGMVKARSCSSVEYDQGRSGILAPEEQESLKTATVQELGPFLWKLYSQSCDSSWFKATTSAAQFPKLCTLSSFLEIMTWLLILETPVQAKPSLLLAEKDLGLTVLEAQTIWLSLEIFTLGSFYWQLLTYIFYIET